MKTLTVQGLASQKTWRYPVSEEQLSWTVLTWLLHHNVPVANSCGQRGECRSCVFNHSLLSCQYTLAQWPADQAMVFSYL